MDEAKQEQIDQVKVTIPFESEEGARFRDFLAVRGAKAGPFVRQILLTVMDPAAGPIVEAAMRGRPLVDTSSEQAKELRAAIEARAADDRASAVIPYLSTEGPR